MRVTSRTVAARPERVRAYERDQRLPRWGGQADHGAVRRAIAHGCPDRSPGRSRDDPVGRDRRREVAHPARPHGCAGKSRLVARDPRRARGDPALLPETVLAPTEDRPKPVVFPSRCAEALALAETGHAGHALVHIDRPDARSAPPRRGSRQLPSRQAQSALSRFRGGQRITFTKPHGRSASRRSRAGRRRDEASLAPARSLPRSRSPRSHWTFGSPNFQNHPSRDLTKNASQFSNDAWV